MHTMQVVIIAQLFRVRSVNSHSIKECELSFHQTSYKRYTTMCDIYIIHIQGATVCYIHPPEKRKTVTQPPHLHTTPPCPHPSSNPTAACPPTCATHPCHLRSSADTSSLPLWSLLFMKGKRREKEKFFFLSLSLAAAAWLLCCWKRQLLRQRPEDGQFPPTPPLLQAYLLSFQCLCSKSYSNLLMQL